MNECKACPFCGSTNLVDGSWYLEDEEVAAIECNDCTAGAPASVWNRRAADPLPDCPEEWTDLEIAVAEMHRQP